MCYLLLSCVYVADTCAVAQAEMCVLVNKKNESLRIFSILQPLFFILDVRKVDTQGHGSSICRPNNG